MSLSWSYRLLLALTRPFVRTTVLPKEVTELEIPEEAEICYVLDSNALSSRLVLEFATAELGVPSALEPPTEIELRRSRRVFALFRKEGWIIQHRSVERHPEALEYAVAAARKHPDKHLTLLPVTVLLGRAPDKHWGLFKTFFSEGWVVAGRTRRLVALLLHGRQSFVCFGSPISLQSLNEEGLNEKRTVRRSARLLRQQLRGMREAAIGPDLSHRRTVVESLLTTDTVREAISRHAQKHRLEEWEAEKKAQRYAMEIAADYSPRWVRQAARVLTWFWNRIYDGIDMHHFERLRSAATNSEIIYVPCHRSHIDYLLLSYLLYCNGLAPPHIAAGVNLNLPLVGAFLRRGGAFFLRRSFRNNRLYAAVFSEYVSTIHNKGVSIEYFLEGTRSRTGKLLKPRLGMLSMSVRSYLHRRKRPIAFQPVYIGYEKLTEGNSYSHELTGSTKRKESLRGLFSALSIVRQKFGKVHVSFGEPLFLAEFLDQHCPDWQEAKLDIDERPKWLQSVVSDLADKIMVRINNSADVNAVNLLAICLLATPKKAMAESDLEYQLGLVRELLCALPETVPVTISRQSGSEIIEHCLALDLVQRVPHRLGAIISATESQAVHLSYLRNNVVHLIVMPSWIACCFVRSRTIDRERLVRLGGLLYPYIASELFLPWSDEEFCDALQKMVDHFITSGLLEQQGDNLIRPEGGTHSSMQLGNLAHSMLQTLERYYIVVTTLINSGPGTLRVAELENLCQLTAERISLLQEFNAPEYFDKALFRNFIAKLRERELLHRNEMGNLVFDQRIEAVAEDAKMILSKELRHAVLYAALQESG